VVGGMTGDSKKIFPVLGYFQPIVVEDGFFDLVVASSAIHHSPDLGGLLQEIARTLKHDGKLVILNETPWKFSAYFCHLVKNCIQLIIAAVWRRTAKVPKVISVNGILYDPGLGDYMHSFYQWNQAIAGAGFSSHLVSTNLFTQKHQVGQRVKLVHFICEKKNV